MGIFSRTRDIIAANVTDLLDKAENPAKLMRMIVLEMEETLAELRATVARSGIDQDAMRARIAELTPIQHGWTEKAELAVAKCRDDLARAALRERQRAADLAEELVVAIAVHEDARRATDEDIARLQIKLAEARTRQRAIAARAGTGRQRIGARLADRRVEDAFARCDRLERRVDRAEENLIGIALDAEIAKLRGEEQAVAELEAMKVARRGA